MRHVYVVAVGLTAAANICQPASARAEPPPRADIDALLVRAQQALDTNDAPEQLASLRGLNALAPEPRVTCTLGMVERRLGQWPEAAEHLTKCVANPPKGKDAEWLANMGAEKAMARAQVGILTITAPPGAEVSIDGEELGAAAGGELFLEAKREHRIDVRGGLSIQRYMMTLGRGKTRNLIVTFPAGPPFGDWLTFGGFMTAGVVALGSGVLFGVSAYHSSQADHHLAVAKKINPLACARVSSDDCGAAKSSADRAVTLQDAGWGVLFGAGGIALTTAIYSYAKPESGAPRVTLGVASVKVEAAW